MSPDHIPLDEGNIELDYRVRILFVPGMETVLFADGVSVFMDEHNVQWAKFYAKNGPVAGKEHIVRTDQILIVRES